MEHRPVLRDEVTDILVPALDAGGVFVDGTLGRAGHARHILEQAPRCHLIGIDRDADALESSRANLAAHQDRVTLVRDNFKDLPAVLERLGIASVRGILLDLGVSSPQLDRAERGFSHRGGGPLDMRMDASAALTADVVVNEYEQKDLERVIFRYGEERFARRIARAIVAKRPLSSTDELADVVKKAIPAATRRMGGHPARRTFQAIRIEVNDELGSLESALPAAIDALEPGGRLAVLTYHSLEDRITKSTFRAEAEGCTCPPELPVCGCGSSARVRILTRKPIKPHAQEIDTNPRARSAKLRAVERIAAAASGEPMKESA